MICDEVWCDEVWCDEVWCDVWDHFYFCLSSYKVPSIPLDPPSLHLLLRRATAALCGHTGYEG